MDILLVILPILFPFGAALALALGKPRKVRPWTSAAGAAELVLLLPPIITGADAGICRCDRLGAVFALLAGVVFLLWAISAREHTGAHLFLMSLGALVSLSFAANPLFMVLSFAAVCLLGVPAFRCEGTERARLVGSMFLMYAALSVILALFGTVWGLLGGPGPVCAFISILGFGAMAGLFPLYPWLPDTCQLSTGAALISSLINNAGILCIIRTVYTLFGQDLIRGTWVQYAWSALAIATALMGTWLALREKFLRRELGYANASHCGYILIGLASLTAEGFMGALLHVVFRTIIDCGLTIAADSILHYTGISASMEMRGIGRQLPRTMAAFCVLSLGLAGVPPIGGFISLWHLGLGSLASGLGILGWLGALTLPVCIVVTAGYILPSAVGAFWPGAEFDFSGLSEDGPNGLIVWPVTVCAAFTVLLGLWPAPLTELIAGIMEVL